MPPPKFDPTVNLGHILTVLTMLVAGFAAWASINAQISGHEIRISQMEKREAEIQALAFRMQTAEALITTQADALVRGRSERLEFQRQTVEAQQRIMETLSNIRADIAALRASQPPAKTR